GAEARAPMGRRSDACRGPSTYQRPARLLALREAVALSRRPGPATRATRADPGPTPLGRGRDAARGLWIPTARVRIRSGRSGPRGCRAGSEASDSDPHDARAYLFRTVSRPPGPPSPGSVRF